MLALTVTATLGRRYSPKKQLQVWTWVNSIWPNTANFDKLNAGHTRTQLYFKNVTTPSCVSRWLASHLAGNLNICLRDT